MSMFLGVHDFSACRPSGISAELLGPWRLEIGVSVFVWRTLPQNKDSGALPTGGEEG